MKKVIVLAVVMFLSFNLKAQDADFVPSWYIVESGCSFSDGTSNGTTNLSVGEVVFVYMKVKDTYFCTSINRPDIFIKGNLTKVVDKGKVGILIEAVTLMDTELSTGEVFWVTAIDAGTSQATILLNNAQKINVPSKSIEMASKPMLEISQNTIYVLAKP